MKLERTDTEAAAEGCPKGAAPKGASRLYLIGLLEVSASCLQVPHQKRVPATFK
jgi:hypothetical protein